MFRDRLQRLLSTPRAPEPPTRVGRDWVLLAVVVLVMVIEATARPELPGRWISLAIGLSLAPFLLVRRTMPLTALAVPFALGFLHSTVVLATGADVPTLNSTAWVLLLVYSLVRWGSGREVAIGLGLVLTGAVASIAATGVDVGSAVAPGGTGSGTTLTLAEDLFGAVVVLGGTIELAFAVRQADASRRRQIADVVAAERRDLARELHDTVAHHVSAIAVHAQAGRVALADDPGTAVTVLARVEEEASQALVEMRGLVRVLRDDADATRRPQPGLADLQLLADDRRRPRVRVEVDDRLGALDQPLPTTLFRLARESVTNARRHARGATEVVVHVSADEDTVHLRVTDDGSPGPTGERTGYGLVGMAERARLVGGSCTAGPAPGGGWAVRATLPRRGAGA